MRIEVLSLIRVKSASIKIMASTLAAQSIDTAPLFDRSGVSPAVLDDPTETISGLKELHAQHVFVEMTADRPDLWLQTGRQYRMLHYGLGGLVAITSANLDELARSLLDWSHLAYSLSNPQPIISDGIAQGVELDVSEVPEYLKEFTTYRDFGALMRLFEDLAVGPLIENIEMSYPQPKQPIPMELVNDIPMRFAADRSSVCWSRESALQPFLHADPAMHEAFLKQSLEVATVACARKSLLTDVAKLFESQNTDPSIDEVAAQLNMSTRTFQRRLHDHNETFQSLRSRIRTHQAKSMLRKSDLSIAEIAWRLGYADSAAFSHAFRRWTGSSPRQYRGKRD